MQLWNKAFLSIWIFQQGRSHASTEAAWLQVPYVKEGLEAIIFTADGDMRQALNNLQATHFGFGLVDAAAVFKACLLHYLLPTMARKPVHTELLARI